MAIQLKDIEKLPIDFEEIMEVLKQRIQAKLPNRWTDFLQSNFGIELLEAVAYEAMLLNYYINININEAFMPTAKTDFAVRNLARTIGYKPKRASQSVVPVILYLDSPRKYDVFISKYTKLSTENGIKFYTTEDSMIVATEKEIEVNCKSGILTTDVIVSNGIAKHRYKLRKNNVILIESVKTENFEYEYKDFIDTQSKEPFYTIEYDSDDNAYIIFGDNIYGINPPEGETITVLYVVNNNSIENSNVQPNTITLVDSVIYDSNNEIVSDIHAYNDIAASGGSSNESLEEIKRNAPSIYRTQQRAVTRQDYKDLTLALPQIEKVSVIDTYNMEEIGIFGVKICPIQTNGGYLNRLLKNEIQKYLEDRKIISTRIDIIDPSYITFDVNILLQASPSANINILNNTIKKEITSYLSWKNRDFGEEISKSEIQRRISSLSDVLQVYSVDMQENRRIYITKVLFENGSNETNKIVFYDSINILRVGSKIAIADINNVIQITAVITKINEDGSFSLNSNITKDMKIINGCSIYPIQKVFTDHKFGEKEIQLRHEYVYENEQFFLELKEEYEQLLNNMSHCVIYFENSPDEKYTVLYRTGDKIYLDRPLAQNVNDKELVYILYKYNIPSLSAVALAGTNRLKFKNYPRFGRNTVLRYYEFEQFENVLFQMIKSNSNYDYLDLYYDTSGLNAIVRIYLTESKVFVENVDYELENNMKIIKWTETGRLKINPGERFYVDATRKIIKQSDQTFTVTKIDGKYVHVTPSVTKTLYEDSTFNYDTETYNLMPNEISDIGSITINIV